MASRKKAAKVANAKAEVKIGDVRAEAQRVWGKLGKATVEASEASGFVCIASSSSGEIVQLTGRKRSDAAKRVRDVLRAFPVAS